MNLHEVRVDLNGRIVAVGRIDHAPDATGHFFPTAHDCVRIWTNFDGIVSLASTTASRDPASGFLTAEEVSSVVYLPRSLSTIVLQSLKRRPSHPVRATLANQEGRMDSESSSEPSWSQPLSDWVIDVVENGSDLKFSISAALQAINPVKSWQTRTGDFWPDRPSSRVEINFIVDAVTCIAVFGTTLSLEEAKNASELTSDPITNAANPQLRYAAIGTGGEVYGRTRDNEWVCVNDRNEDLKTIYLTKHRSLQRLDNGFVTTQGQPLGSFWIALLGFDVDALIRMTLGDGKRGSLELTQGWFGSPQRIHHNDEDYAPIGRILLRSHLSEYGLELSFSLAMKKS